MKLIIDIGNTSTKLALFDDKKAVKFSDIDECKLIEIQDFVGEVVITSSIISSVKEALHEIDLSGMTVIDVKGFGRRRCPAQRSGAILQL